MIDWEKCFDLINWDYIHAAIDALGYGPWIQKWIGTLYNKSQPLSRRVLVNGALTREFFITRGILDASLIHPREVFRPAITESAAAIILVHNHPSGDPTPSAEDRSVTKQLTAAGRTVGISVVDHIVIGDGRFVSLADDGPLG